MAYYGSQNDLCVNTVNVRVHKGWNFISAHPWLWMAGRCRKELLSHLTVRVSWQLVCVCVLYMSLCVREWNGGFRDPHQIWQENSIYLSYHIDWSHQYLYISSADSNCGITLITIKIIFDWSLLFFKNSKILGYSEALTIEVNGVSLWMANIRFNLLTLDNYNS